MYYKLPPGGAQARTRARRSPYAHTPMSGPLRATLLEGVSASLGARFHDLFPWRPRTTYGLFRSAARAAITLSACTPGRWRSATARFGSLRAHRRRAVDLRANADRRRDHAGAVGSLHRRQPGARPAKRDA